MNVISAIAGWSRVFILLGWTMPAILAGPVATAEPIWAVDPVNSYLGFTARIGDGGIPGSFYLWTAIIAFDPEQPETATLRVEIDMASVTMADPRAQTVGETTWLGSAEHPKAVFEASGFQWMPGGALTIEGVLTLKGIAAPLTLTGMLRVDGSKAEADVTGEILRLTHGIGIGQDAIAAEVEVHVKINAIRQTN